MELPRMAVLFGPNATGKSNLLDAIQALSRIGTQRTLADALDSPIRGYPIEAFSFPEGGLSELLSQPSASFVLEADLAVGSNDYRYRTTVQIEPTSGQLSIQDEYVAQISAKTGNPKYTAAIEKVGDNLHIRRKSKPARPREERVGLNHSLVSDPRFSGREYNAIERVRKELEDWRTYYLDPRVAMRVARPPADVFDIGVLGENIAPFLFKLRAKEPKCFDAISRTLRQIIPSVQRLDIDLDKDRGTLDLVVRQGGIDYSSRIISEGTLRVLALCAIAVNPWGGDLIAFEEPENGVHPRRLELIAKLLLSMSATQERPRQLVVTTHSPLFCDALLKENGVGREGVGLFNVRREGESTIVSPFDVTGPLFTDSEIAAALASRTEDGRFEGLVLRGLIDE